jgi:hypothetical protein
MGRPEDLFKRICEFGEEAIDELILDRQSEELFLDFKQSADKGGGVRLHDDDRKNLAKAISGFGNSEGGVVIWGVDCRPDSKIGDVAKCKVAIENPKRFKSWLEGAVSGCTVPPHPMVRHHPISTSSRQGFVVTYIAKSYYAPHQCLKPSLQYYIRAGSDFVPTPHAVLAGLFGRRPQPFVFHMWCGSPPKLVSVPPDQQGIEFNFGIQLGSHGPGLARDLYLNLDFVKPKGNTQMWVTPDKTNWTGNFAFGRMTQLVSMDSFKLAPQSFTQPLTLKIVFVPPFEGDLSYKIVFGHEGSPTRKVEAVVSKGTIQVAYKSFLKSSQRDEEASTNQLMTDFLGIAPSTEESGPEHYGFPE